MNTTSINRKKAVGKIGSQNPGLASVISAGETAPNPSVAGEKHIQVPMKLIELDPDQVRKIGLSIDDVSTYRDDPESIPERHQDAMDKLQGLARSIESKKLLNPIRVVKQPTGIYKVLIGERRTLAHVVLERESIPGFLDIEAQDNWSKSSVQLIENIQHEKLSVRELTESLRKLARGYILDTGNPVDVDFIKTELGVSQANAYRYENIMNADEKTYEFVLEKIISGELTKLVDVAKHMKLPIKEVERVLKPRTKKKTFSMGSINNTKALIEVARCLDKQFRQTDLKPLTDAQWRNTDSVKSHLKALIKSIEAQCE